MDLTFKRGLALALALAACTTTTDTTDGTTDDTGDTGDSDVTCTAGIKGDPTPTVGATDVFVKSTFAMEFLADESGTTDLFALYEGTFSADSAPTGEAIALEDASFTEDGKNVYTSPSSPLKASTAYTLVVSMSCDKTAYITFTTSNVGTAVMTDDILGMTYAIQLDSATIVEPAGVGSLLGSLLTGLTETVGIVPSEYDDMAKELKFVGGLINATNDGYEQECEETIAFGEGIDFSGNPFFELEADELSIAAAGIEVTLQDLALSGAFTPDGSDIVGITLAGLIDTRALLDVLGDELGAGEGDDAACNLLKQFTGGKVDCIDCPDNEGPYCLRLIATNTVGEGTDLEFVEYTSTDVDNECAPIVAAQ